MTGMQALRTAAPYLNQFRGHVFVVKLGGEVLDAPAALRSVAEQLALFWHLGMKVVVVHGGGTSIDALCDQLQLRTVKIAGRRVTTPETLDVVKMSLAGKVHVDLLATLRSVGLPIVGLTGLDAGLLEAKRRPPIEVDVAGESKEVDFGLVGDIQRVNPRVLHELLNSGYMPIVAPLSGNDDGDVFNTNADTVAAALAASLEAEKLIFVLRVPGLLRDIKDPNSLIPHVTLNEVSGLVHDGTASAGMLPKLTAARRAIEDGVKAVHLVGAFLADSLLLEVFTNEGSGTMIERDAP